MQDENLSAFASRNIEVLVKSKFVTNPDPNNPLEFKKTPGMIAYYERNASAKETFLKYCIDGSLTIHQSGGRAIDVLPEDIQKESKGVHLVPVGNSSNIGQYIHKNANFVLKINTHT